MSGRFAWARWGRWMIPQYPCFYFNVGVIWYQLYFDIDFQKYIRISTFLLFNYFQYQHFDWVVWAQLVQGSGQLFAVCSSVLGTDCSEGSFTPSKGHAAPRGGLQPKRKWGWARHLARPAASMVASSDETDRDLAGTQFPRYCMPYNIIEF